MTVREALAVAAKLLSDEGSTHEPPAGSPPRHCEARKTPPKQSVGRATTPKEEWPQFAQIDDPSLVARVLLQHVLRCDRVQIRLDIDKQIELAAEQAFFQAVQRQLHGEPVAYITGHREFFGLDFIVDSRVLIPRPETELLVEEVIALASRRSIEIVADIGTGSGAISVSLAASLAQIKIYATDVSPAALEVAALNCRRHGVSDRITLLAGDLLEPLPEKVDVIVANLPYVRKAELPAVTSGNFEPSLALDGGECGLDQIIRLGRQLPLKLQPAGCTLLEIGAGQSDALTVLLRNLYPSAEISVLHDLAGVGRAVKLTFPASQPICES